MPVSKTELKKIDFKIYPVSPAESKVVDAPRPSPTLLKTQLKPTKDPTISYSRHGAAGQFVMSDWDLSEVGRIEDVESYVSMAFRKKIGAMFKEGYDFVGNNKETISYVKERFRQISAATSIPTAILFRDMASSLIKISNTLVAKVRDTSSSGGKIRTENGKELKPIAGYFIVPAETVKAEIDKSKNIKRWVQELYGKTVNFNKEDIVHIYYDRKPGFVFGRPSIIPVKEDIQILRRIEEDVELLIYEYLFPLYHFQVGTEDKPAGINEKGESEIAVLRGQIQYMPSEGAIVTSERYKITPIGAQGKALQVETYIQHFKNRVFTGLAMSSVDFGEGDCHDELTMTLTENGWKFHNEIDHSVEKIATYNPETELIEFHTATYKYEGRYVGDMICFNGKHIDIKVTPHHEMWVCHRSSLDNKFLGPNWHKVKAMDLLDGEYSEFLMLETAEFAEMKKKGDIQFHLPSAKVKRGRKSKAITCSMQDWASFVGWFVSEGNLDKYNGDRSFYRINITQNSGEKLDSILSLLDRIGVTYSCKKDKRDTSISSLCGVKHSKSICVKIYGKNIYEYFRDRVGHGAKNKNLPREIFSWDKASRKSLLTSLLAGDGYVCYKYPKINSTYFTSSERLANDVQVLAMSLGYMAKVAKYKNQKGSLNPDGYMYRVLISGGYGKTYRIIDSKMISKCSYDGMIYCYNVPNHLFVTRRNGKTTIQGNSTNRATADTLSRAAVDDVKDFQLVFETFVNEFIIKELLLESTFGDTVLDEKNIVRIRFNEIDLESRIKVENHATNCFNSNGITFEEYRRELSREPLDEEEFKRTYWELFKKPEVLMQSIDEPYSENSSSNIKAKSGAASEAKSKDQPSNQHGKKLAPGTTKDIVSGMYSFITLLNLLFNKTYRFWDKESSSNIKSAWDSYRDVIVKLINDNSLNASSIKAYNELHQSLLTRECKLLVKSALINGYKDSKSGPIASPYVIRKWETEFGNRIDSFVRKLFNDVTSKILSIDSNDINDKINLANSILDSYTYRLVFISETESSKAYNIGKVCAFSDLGVKTIIAGEDKECKICKRAVLDIENKNFSIEDIPPFHFGCVCKIEQEENN